MKEFPLKYAIWLGLILLITSSCAVVKGKKELVYHRDQNNRLYAVSEVQHIKHEQVMDLIPKGKNNLAFFDKLKSIQPIVNDTTGNYKEYKRLRDDSLWAFNIGYLSLSLFMFFFVIAEILIALTEGNDNLYLIVLALFFLFLSLLSALYIHSIRIGYILHREMLRFKRDNGIYQMESRWHNFLYDLTRLAIIISLIFGGMMVLGIILAALG